MPLAGLNLFDKSIVVRPFKKQQPLEFYKDTIPRKTALEHHLLEIVGLQIIQKIFVWPRLSIETAGDHIVRTVLDTFTALLA